LCSLAEAGNVAPARHRLALIGIVQQATNPPKATEALTGTWVMDLARSVLSDARPRDVSLVLVDDGETITVTERIADKKDDRFSCRSDGQPCEQTTTGSVYRRVLRRVSGALVWEIAMTRLSDGASIKWKERWATSDDGRPAPPRVATSGRASSCWF
jgi:hypothetical protein